MTSKIFYNKLFVLVCVSLAVIFFTLLIIRHFQREAAFVSHQQKGRDLSHLFDAWLKIVNKIQSRHRFQSIENVLETINLDEENDNWMRCPFSKINYCVNPSVKKWELGTTANEIAIFCPQFLVIDGIKVYLAVSFGGEKIVLVNKPEWAND